MDDLPVPHGEWSPEGRKICISQVFFRHSISKGFEWSVLALFWGPSLLLRFRPVAGGLRGPATLAHARGGQRRLKNAWRLVGSSSKTWKRAGKRQRSLGTKRQGSTRLSQ